MSDYKTRLVKIKQRRKMSTGLKISSFNCYSYNYYFIDQVRVPTEISFCFPQDLLSERKACCNLIKQRKNKDGFRISKSTRMCEKHFFPEKVYRSPWGTSKRLILGARLILKPWNNFNLMKSIGKSLWDDAQGRKQRYCQR